MEFSLQPQLLPQGQAFEKAVEIAKKNRTLDVGIHLTLIEEFPILEPNEIPSIVNKNGKFLDHAKDFFIRYLLGKISKDDVYKELDAQINKVLNHGIKITHIDSHQHMHVLKDIFDISLHLSAIYDIPIIRIPFEPIRPYMFTKNLLPRIVSLKVLNFISNQRKKGNFYSPDYFFGFPFGGNLNKENLLKIFRLLPEFGVCEVMCHPGLDDPASYYSHWNYNWGVELKALTDPEISNFIKEKGIDLINFKDLVEEKNKSGIPE